MPFNKHTDTYMMWCRDAKYIRPHCHSSCSNLFRYIEEEASHHNSRLNKEKDTSNAHLQVYVDFEYLMST